MLQLSCGCHFLHKRSWIRILSYYHGSQNLDFLFMTLTIVFSLFNPDIWWCWYCLPSTSTYISIYLASRGCYTRSQYIKVICCYRKSYIKLNCCLYVHFYYDMHTIFMIWSVGYCRKQLNLVKKQKNWRKQPSHSIRMKEVVQRVENIVKM
jgi:hypothetical protein